MCAITGWLCEPGRSPPAATLRALQESMRHRGPDDEGEFLDDAHGLALGHRRLAIIDLSAASHQPMVDEASGLVLVYNGELFNFRALRAELAALGHRFRSAGDTEVVLRAFLEWGVECFGRLCGMFALALWDPRSRTLHLARDAMGIKPLYWIEEAGRFVFASEIKAFARLPGFTPALDDRSLQQYLEFGYVFDEDATMLRGVNKLAPGSRIEVRNGRIVARHAWFRPPAPEPLDAKSEAERVAALAELLPQVVREHLESDVPLGLLLSGGIDSSLIAALAAREGPLHTITMGFGSGVDERANARAVSTFIGSRHTEIEISPQDVRAVAEDGAWVFDDLFADWGAVSTRLLYRRCREMGLKVVLVGEGADELFGGYDVFRQPRRLGLAATFRLYQRYAGRRHGRFFGEFRRIMDAYGREGDGDAFHAVRLFESRRQLPNQYVMKVDKASMAESVEARAPFLDRRVAEFAYRTPRDALLGTSENKRLLRQVALQRELLPPATCAQPKFGAPLASNWMDEDAAFRAFARERILAPGSRTRDLRLDGPMRAYFDEGRPGYPFPAALSVFRNLAWRLLLLELWAPHALGARA